MNILKNPKVIIGLVSAIIAVVIISVIVVTVGKNDNKVKESTTEAIKKTEVTTVASSQQVVKNEEHTTEAPTEAPTEAVTEAPTEEPTEAPTEEPYVEPTYEEPVYVEPEPETPAYVEPETETPAPAPAYEWLNIDVSVPGEYSGQVGNLKWHVKVVPGCLDAIEYYKNVLKPLCPDYTTTYQSPFGTIVENCYNCGPISQSQRNLAKMNGQSTETVASFKMRGVYSTNTTVFAECISPYDIDGNDRVTTEAGSEFNCWFGSGRLK